MGEVVIGLEPNRSLVVWDGLRAQLLLAQHVAQRQLSSSVVTPQLQRFFERRLGIIEEVNTTKYGRLRQSLSAGWPNPGPQPNSMPRRVLDPAILFYSKQGDAGCSSPGQRPTLRQAPAEIASAKAGRFLL